MTAQPQTQAAEGRLLSAIPPGVDVRGVDLALDAMGIGIFEWDVPTGAHRFSERCKTIWGFSLDEDMTAEMILARVHPEDLHLAATVREAIAPDGPGRYSIEHRIVLPDGSIRWLSVSGRTEFEESAGVRRAVRGYGAMRDVTERRLAEQQLYERTSQLRTFIEGAPVPIAIFDREMRYLAVSRRYVEKRHLDAARLIGQSAYDLFPDMPRHWVEAQQRVLKEGTSEGLEADCYTRPDGSQEWLRWAMRPWYRADNEIGGLLLFSEFITERVRAQQALRDSQARLELAVRAGALGTFDYDFIARTVDWDARVRELWGFSPDEPITYEMFIGQIHPDDREWVGRSVEARQPGTDSEGYIAQEYRVVNRRDGRCRWVAATGRMYCEGGNPVRCVGVVQDITERKRTELALEATAAELRRADDRKNVYLATLSHELRNPLAPIRTAAQILASPKLTPEQLKWLAQVIGRQTAHMALLLEDLLEITRICRGKLVLRREVVALSGIAQSAIESARPLIDERGHRLIVHLPAEPLMVHADPVRISQVLSNLLTNAAKYTEPGGRIELVARVEGHDLVMRVRDNGRGIPPEHLDKIFTMFWQAESSRSDPSHTGLGIGLAFVKGIVELHGGTIEAHSEGAGRGSELIVRLPVLELAGASPAVPAPEPAWDEVMPHNRAPMADGVVDKPPA